MSISMYERVTLRLDEVTGLHYVHRTRQGMFTVFDHQDTPIIIFR